MKSIINKHNFEILNNNKPDNPSKCNCRDRNECLLNGNCLQKNIIYKGIITREQPGYKEKVYLGSAGTTFILQYGNHLESFKNK